MRRAPRALFAGLIAALTLSLAACGSSSGLLSSHQASSLRAGLDQINRALNQHDCSAAQSEAVALKSRVANLPGSVNGTVRNSLTQAASKLEVLVLRDCAPVATNTQPATTPTTTTTATTSTTPAAPKKKPKKPHTTPATTPTPTGTTTGPAPGPGNGNGKGNGNGNGKGGGNGNGQGGGDPTTPTTPTTPGNP
jgi:Flp pilus assembly protein TadG